MTMLHAIYTERRECQDCHKCIRECPVKAIRVQDGYARVVPEMCVLCGNCIVACPNNAKQVRNDLPRVKEFLASGRKVIASVAPSFVAQFPGLRAGQLIHGLKKLGFLAVSETALGAQLVSESVQRLMVAEPGRVWVSSACPVVVDFISKYHPESQSNVSPLLSPLLTHCKLLRAHYGNEIAVVFIGPCIAKKKEAEKHPELLDVVLTFEDLENWLEEESIELPLLLESEEDRFALEDAHEGALYPIEGGMMAGITRGGEVRASQVMSFSGMANVEQALKGIGEWRPEHNIFLELTACAGSCVNGPKAARNRSIARRRFEVLEYAKPADSAPRAGSVARTDSYAAFPVLRSEHSELQVAEALRSVGKYSAEDELNCGGCGYESCRDFAHALIAHNAERMMCATYTRKLAQKKANALLKKMPSAVVIVDEELKIIECNRNFLRLFSEDVEVEKELEGAALDAVIPFSSLFQRVLESGEDIVSHDIRYQRSILNTSIFSIEPHLVLCGIFQDITEPVFQKEQIIERARDVIQKNLKTVQQIAYLLGENAADSEIILNSIVRSFSPDELDDRGFEKSK
ncbi:MAG TPA: [Fe-Fe] hydrogenase large subunit C-terminal domain-containing protein [Terracidiphilus sp.]|nr:[Fe-Fe] hydrogenase large subunit C-terminal domain-containing protein [Terracidiphilus sp.]